MQQPGSITFGTPLAPTTGNTGTFGGFGSGPTFGSTNTGLKFGGTPTTSSNLFGGGLAAPANPTGGLNFGAPASTAAQSGFSFGTNTTQTQPAGGLSFGAQATTTTSGSGFSFGAQPTAATTAPSTGLNFGSFNKPASTTQPLSFGLTSTSAATAPSLVPPGTTGNSLFTGSGSGLFAKPATTTTTLTGLNPIVSQQQQQQPLQAQPVQQQPTNIGLGGVDTFQNKSGQSGATTKESDGKLTKEQQLPNEFLQLIDGFKNHIKQQKMYSSDVARGNVKPVRRIQEDIDQLRTQLAELGNSIGIVNRQQAEKLKYETAKCLSHAEMAQRIHDTPPGFQIDNTQPLQYFIDTVHKFENDLSAIRQQIEATEKHIKSLERPKALSSQEMTLGLRRLHETFVALAGRLQSLHSQVEMQKTQYLNMRKYLFKDTMSGGLFDQTQFTNQLNSTLGACTGSLNSIHNVLNRTNTALNNSSLGSFTPPKRAAGPTPFSTLGKNTLSFISTAQQQTNNNDVTGGGGSGGASPHVGTNTNTNQSSISSGIPPPAYPSGSSTLNWGSLGAAIKTTQPPSYNASIGLTTNSTLFGSPGTSLGSPSNDFQLQKPPTGNKRGKH